MRRAPPTRLLRLLLVLALTALVAACGQTASPSAQTVTSAPAPFAEPSPTSPPTTHYPTARPVAEVTLTSTPQPTPEASPTPLAAATVAASSTSTATASTPTAALGAPSSLADRAFSGDRALAHVRWLAGEIGSRPAGEDAERRAAEGLAERLRLAGFEVTIQPVPIKVFQDRGSTLRVGGEEIPARALAYSRAGVARAALVDVGLGRPADLAGKAIRGAIALVERGQIPFSEKARNAAGAGAIGVVVYNSEAGVFAGSVGELSAIPIVAIDRDAGRQLARRLIAGALSADLTVDSQVIDGASQNVVAALSGPTDRVVVLGGHYDSVAAGPGANDNASGVAVALELARTLGVRPKDSPLPFGIRVVFFGAEEIGLVGSRQYVTSLSPEERRRIIAMLNFDMVGVGERAAVAGSTRLVESAEAAAARLKVGVTRLPSSSGGRDSDHSSFADVGIPAIFFHRLDDPRYHTAEDRAEFISATALAEAGKLALGVLESLGLR